MCWPTVIRWFVRGLLWICTNLFFREIDCFNDSKIPKEGPVIFVCAPHANQFLDPLVVSQKCNRTIGFLAAKKSMDRKYVGRMIKAMDSIPVKRPQDYMVKAKGTVTVEGLKVIGKGTEFTKGFSLASAVYFTLAKDAFDIASVDSDTQITLRQPADREIVDSTIKVVPKIDQNEVYDRVFEELKNGGCIGIFPEGGSHDRTSLLPLKAGVTLMALGAMAKHPGLDVKIVPCGLTYFHAHRFRSSAFVDFGDPISIPAEMVEGYKAGKERKREACAGLLDMIYHGLHGVTINVPDYQTLQLMRMFRRLYNPGQKLTVQQKLELTRRMGAGYEKFRDDPSVQAITKECRAYMDDLKYHHVTDSQVGNQRIGGCFTFWLLIYRVFKLVIFVICAIPGTVLYSPVAFIANHISNKKAREALASSNVKIAGRDVLATWKVMVALLLIPLLTLVYAAIAAILFATVGSGESIYWDIFLPIGIFFLLPFAGYAGVRFFETSFMIYRSLIPLLVSTCCCNCCKPEGVLPLKERRASLQKSIHALVERLGPQLFGGLEEFQTKRVVPASAFHDVSHDDEKFFAKSPRGDSSASVKPSLPPFGVESAVTHSSSNDVLLPVQDQQ